MSFRRFRERESIGGLIISFNFRPTTYQQLIESLVLALMYEHIKLFIYDPLFASSFWV